MNWIDIAYMIILLAIGYLAGRYDGEKGKNKIFMRKVE